MNKYFVVLLIALGLTSCSSKDEQYYRTNPNELQQALKACPKQQPQGLTCGQLDQLGKRLNVLAYELQYSPQGFGNKILALQELIGKQQIELTTNKTTELQQSLEQNRSDLADYLAVVKWLESPEN